MDRRSGMLVVWGALLAGAAGCKQDERASCASEIPGPYDGVADIGVMGTAGFQPINDGDSMTLALGGNGLMMIVPSIRAEDLDPRRPDVCIETIVLGRSLGFDLAGERTNMRPDGAGYVLQNVQVPFQVKTCCVTCREAIVDAYLRDVHGRQFHGQRQVLLERGGGCPDPGVCCETSADCPAPELMRPVCGVTM